MQVSLRKLEKYCKDQGGFEVTRTNDNVALSFVPTFPEAQEKGDSTTPRVTMYGKLHNGLVTFDRFEVENESGRSLKDPEDAELTYGSWVAYIEENY